MTAMTEPRKILRTIVTALAAVTLAGAVTSCGSTSGRHGTIVKAESYRPGRTGEKPAAPRSYEVITEGLPGPSRDLLEEARTWIGTPYLWGGNDRNGVDCSGFVTQVYLAALDIKLPRTSATQHEYCTPLSRNQLSPGDLVFFATGKDSTKVSHVGLYIGEGKMLHSSSSRGVIVSSLSERYYTRTYLGAGRVERYHAMVDKVKAPAAPPKAAPAPPKTTPTPAVKVKAGKPEKRKKPEAKPVAPRPRVETPTPVMARAERADRPVAADPSQARADFLNSLIEEKADSIFSAR